MTSSKPYLIRAIYDWIIDNHLTPYIVIKADGNEVQIPEAFVEDGQITLNISPVACRGLHIGNDRVVFSARFSGTAHQIYAPPSNIMAIYAKENGRGMLFGEEVAEDVGGATGAQPAPTSPSTKGKKPTLRVVK